MEGKHKKQSGGHGQYYVWIEFELGEKEELVFEERFEEQFRSNISRCRKGLQECIKRCLAGYPVVNLSNLGGRIIPFR